MVESTQLGPLDEKLSKDWNALTESQKPVSEFIQSSTLKKLDDAPLVVFYN